MSFVSSSWTISGERAARPQEQPNSSGLPSRNDDAGAGDPAALQIAVSGDDVVEPVGAARADIEGRLAELHRTGPQPQLPVARDALCRRAESARSRRATSAPAETDRAAGDHLMPRRTPPGCRAVATSGSESRNVSRPTASETAATPAPLVMVWTRSTKFSLL